MRPAGCFVFVMALGGASAFGQADPPVVKAGHSRHGTAFDSGLRARPYLMKGIGNTPFPITTTHPDTQKYFDQAIALMHSFWWEEAERSLRWCMKLEPENPMVYWALARSGDGYIAPTGRYRDFLNQAIKFKAKATPRERAYIEVWEAAYAPAVKEPEEILRKKLQELILRYPEDTEAKALLAWVRPRSGEEFMSDLLMREIWRQNPNHHGAVHSTIHNWDYANPHQAIDSAERYSQLAPRVGHALHMPGHIYSKIGMWHEAARAMDSATRTELRYLNERMAMPFETWNFPHNRNYLCFIQEQLGMANAALRGARDLLSAPTDPEMGNDLGGGDRYQGRSAFVRGSLKFERYDDILVPGAIPWDRDQYGKLFQAWAECLAYAGKNDAVKARERWTDLEKGVQKMAADANKQLPKPLDRPDVESNEFFESLKEAECYVLLVEGKRDEARIALEAAAALEAKRRLKEPIAGDPPDVPWTTARKLGEFYLEDRAYAKAVDIFERGLRFEPNDGFALSGLALAHHGLGQMDKAREYAGRLAYVWSGADPGLRWLTAVQALKLNAKPIAVTPRPERAYRPNELTRFGPSNWEPFAAPALNVRNVNGQPVSLADYRGKNVLLVFYLSDTCVHCVEQLAKINERMADFEKENTVVLGVSSTAPEANRASLALGSMKIKLLSDRDHENARRFASYDDMEDMELHSTILLDAQGRIRWKRTGGAPFSNVGFLLREIRHFSRQASVARKP